MPGLSCRTIETLFRGTSERIQNPSVPRPQRPVLLGFGRPYFSAFAVASLLPVIPPTDRRRLITYKTPARGFPFCRRENPAQIPPNFTKVCCKNFYHRTEPIRANSMKSGAFAWRYKVLYGLLSCFFTIWAIKNSGTVFVNYRHKILQNRIDIAFFAVQAHNFYQKKAANGA